MRIEEEKGGEGRDKDKRGGERNGREEGKETEKRKEIEEEIETGRTKGHMAVFFSALASSTECR